MHLGGFLNPNIVKLKLLFDKHDNDGSRYLESSEFNRMLKELFKSTPERDIDVLQAELCPPGSDQGITFTQYIQRSASYSIGSNSCSTVNLHGDEHI